MTKSKTAKNYKQLSDELSEIVEWFESDSVNLDEAIEKYQQATQLLDEIEKYLKTAENKITKIKNLNN